MSESFLVPKQMNFKTYQSAIPHYRYARLNVNNQNSSTISLGTNSSTMVEFKIPANSVCNLAKSYLVYQYSIPAGGAGTFACSFEGLQDFCNQVYFGNVSGLGVVDMAYADRHVQVLRPLKIDPEEYKQNDISSCLYPCNQPATSNLLPFSRDGLSAGVLNASTQNFSEPQYLNICPTANTILPINRYLPLNAFVDTFLEMDKDLVYPNDMYLRLFTQYSSRLGFYTTTPNNPSQNVTAITGAVSFTNVYLMLAMEENEALASVVRQQVMGPGLKMMIPYSYNYKYPQAGNSTSFSVTITISPQYGHKLKRMLITGFMASGESGGATANLFTCHANVNGSTSAQYIQTSVNSRPTTDYQLACFNPASSINTGALWTYASQIPSDDWREAKKFVIGSANATYSEYQTNWWYQDSWGMQSNLSAHKQNGIEDGQINDGLELNQDVTWSAQITTPNVAAATTVSFAGVYWYIFALFQRGLLINNAGIAFF